MHLRLLHFAPVCDMFAETASSVYRLGYGLDLPRFESRQGQGIFLFSAKSGPVLQPTKFLFGMHRR